MGRRRWGRAAGRGAQQPSVQSRSTTYLLPTSRIDGCGARWQACRREWQGRARWRRPCRSPSPSCTAAASSAPARGAASPPSSPPCKSWGAQASGEPAAPGEKAEDGPRRSGTVSSGLRSLLPTKAAQAFRSDTLTLQSRIRQLERELGEKGEEAAKYRRLLQEAQEDLAQDEVIFADKMKELKVAQQEIARLKASASAGSNAFNAAQPDTCRQVGGLPILGKDGPSSRGQVREAEGALEGSAAGELAPEDSDLVLLGDRNPSPDPGTAEITPAAALRAARASLDMQLKELMYNIQRKEELIGQLRENEARAHSLSNQYMDRVKEVEEEVKGKESTIRLMQEKLASLETDRRHSLEEKRQLRSHFQAKIGTVTAQLTSLQKQLKERSTGQVAERERERAQARAKQLEEEVASMRRQHESLHSRLREVNQKFEKAAAGWAKEAGGAAEKELFGSSEGAQPGARPAYRPCRPPAEAGRSGGAARAAGGAQRRYTCGGSDLPHALPYVPCCAAAYRPRTG
eukprot:jgi/Botrbrau1/1370/Bobra.0063s0078.1